VGWRGTGAARKIRRMSPSKASSYTWDRERPKGDSSEWPSTGHSTLISGYDPSHSRSHRTRRHSPSLVRKLFLPFVLLLLLSGAGLLGLSRLIHG
jgi:hypothetical protein